MSTFADLLTNVYGGALVGVTLTSILFGVISVQTYKYYQNFPRDYLHIKVIVAALWIFQAFEVVCTTKALHWYLVTRAGNFIGLLDAVWEGTTYQTVSTMASMTTQTFFAYRVYQISHSVILGLFLEALVLLQWGLGAVTSAKAYIYANFPEMAVKERWLVLAWLTAEAVSDSAIATSMVLLLRRQRNGFEKTDGMINTLILYSVNTGAATSIVAIVTAIVFTIKPFHFVVLALAPPLGALYTVCMLANLHSRTAIRKRYFASTIPMRPLPSPTSSGGSPRKQSAFFSDSPSHAYRLDPKFNPPRPHNTSSGSFTRSPQPAIGTLPAPPSRAIAKGGTHIHVEKQSTIVSDPSPPQTFQPRHPLKMYWDEEPYPRAI